MKLKITRRTGGIIFLIFLFAGFVIAPTFFQAFLYFGDQQSSQQQISTIIDYELHPSQEDGLIRQGATIIKYFYNSTCNECKEHIKLLESIANQYSNQMILEKILSNGTTQLDLISALNRKTFFEIKEVEINKELCDTLIAPPATCVKIP